MRANGTGNRAFLELERVTRRFDTAAAAAVADVSLVIRRGEIVALLGPSGCGKSTTLRIIAGLERPDEGTVRLDGHDVTDWPPERRRMGVVFQNYALFPHLSVFENVAFGLRVRGESKEEVRRAVSEALDLVRLSGLERRSVDQLSGGQQQRVALARAIAPRPDVLLLDEPLSNLDATLREETRDTLRALLRQLGVTAVFVTHDQAEALAFADRLGLMRQGQLVEVGTPDRLYREPEVEFTASFLGGANVLAAYATGDGRTVRLEGIEEPIPVGTWARGTSDIPAGRRVSLVARPELLEVVDNARANTIPVTIADTVFLGATYRVTAVLSNGLVVRVITGNRAGTESAWLALPPGALRVVPAGN